MSYESNHDICNTYGFTNSIGVSKLKLATRLQSWNEILLVRPSLSSFIWLLPHCSTPTCNRRHLPASMQTPLRFAPSRLHSLLSPKDGKQCVSSIPLVSSTQYSDISAIKSTMPAAFRRRQVDFESLPLSVFNRPHSERFAS